MDIKVKKLSNTANIPCYATKESACFDICCDKDVIIQPGETVMVSTGLAFQIPEGYQMKIHPRSGVSLKTPLRIANAPGCVDSDYRGEVKVLLWDSAQIYDCSNNYYNQLDGTKFRIEKSPYEEYDIPNDSYLIRKGDRIAQAEIVPVLRASFTEVDQLSTTDRTGGFGSTGVR